MAGEIRADTLTVASSGTDSTTVEMDGDKFAVRLITPAAITSTTLTFKVGIDSSNMVVLKVQDGTTLTYTVAASGAYILEPADFVGARFIQVIMGSAEGAARTLTLVSVPRS